MALLGGVFLLLGFIGSRPVAEPYLSLGQLFTLLYFGLLGGLLLFRLRFSLTGLPFTFGVFTVSRVTHPYLNHYDSALL